MARQFPALLALGLLLSAPVAARELRWRELAVDARLDVEGRLHIRERHAMIFTGDWNGGERSFSLAAGQHLELHSVERIDPGRGAITLERGDLDLVDRWDWHGSDTLRWRSRLPTAPPFAETELVYAIDYTLSDVLVPEGDAYALDHDFAFTDRVGVIERFVLDLELASEWIEQPHFDGHLELSDMAPGRSAIVTLNLRHTARRPLEGVTLPLADRWRHAGLAVTLLALAVLFGRFLARERRLGRFEPIDAPSTPSEAWLEEYVLPWLPEQVGALWDEKVGPPEVAALIARLVAEGKLASSVEQRGRFFKRLVLKLDLLVDRNSFREYEAKLIRKLFVSQRTSIDTDEIRAYYRSTGFSPASTIRPELERSIEKRLAPPTITQKPSYKRTLFLFLGAAAAGAVELVIRTGPTLNWGGLAIAVWLLAFPLGFAGARRWRRNVFGLRARLLYMIAPAVGLAVAYWWLPTVFGRQTVLAPRHFGTLALALVVIGTFSSLLNQAATRVGHDRQQQRQRLAIARRWWRDELEREAPSLSDELLPYLIGLGLQRHIDRWFRNYGGATVPSVHSGTLTSSPSRGGSTWTGGGGAFGGAGATAAWTTAATGMAAGVTAASSSGSGGGGGGGSSSGGGGGGGW